MNQPPIQPSCPHCGNHLPANAVFCENCGQQVARRRVSTAEVISWVLLGVIGLPSALVAGCSVMFLSNGKGQDNGVFLIIAALGGAGISLATLVFFGIRSFRKDRWKWDRAAAALSAVLFLYLAYYTFKPRP
jgi:predicted nucleic acid-binding Zn ribbon protein